MLWWTSAVTLRAPPPPGAPNPPPARNVSSARASTLVGNAFTSERYDRDESTLAPGEPAARESVRSATLPDRNVSDTLMTTDRSLPSHSTLNDATIASVALASMDACTALPS